ncbi:hypothetical protein M8818_003868 [Zalaria obscura]|uniref:Uncharacterized protein n=1 Tax=Zalaria obscura TaxID=2024903 RepID=A0ACC3SDN4_9PEZI
MLACRTGAAHHSRLLVAAGRRDPERGGFGPCSDVKLERDQNRQSSLVAETALGRVWVENMEAPRISDSVEFLETPQIKTYTC